MTQGLSRTHSHSARLIRVLADLAVAEAPESRQTFADRLGLWLDFTDAIALFAVINNAAGGAPARVTPAPSSAGQALRDEFTRVRTGLEESIAIDGLTTPGKARVKLPRPDWHPSIKGAADFLPYQRYYLAHQRDMGAAITPLRSSARAALAALSPAHKQLAQVDGVMEQALGPRERNLLTSVPVALAKHFERLHQAHRAARSDAGEADSPDQWLQPGGWLATFCKDMKTILLAELDLRLQPVAGLLEALGNEVTKQA